MTPEAAYERWLDLSDREVREALGLVDEDRYLEYLVALSEQSPTSLLSVFQLDPSMSPNDFQKVLGEPYLRWGSELDGYAAALRERQKLYYDLEWARIFVDEAMPDFTPYSNLGKAFLARAAIRRALRDFEGLLDDFAEIAQCQGAPLHRLVERFAVDQFHDDDIGAPEQSSKLNC